MRKNYYCIKEYGYFVDESVAQGIEDFGVKLPHKTFLNLEELVLKNNDDENVDKIFTLSSKRAVGKVIRVKNYVGVIQLKDGAILEILPKIYSKNIEESYDKTRRILLKMLRTVKNLPFYKYDLSSLSTEHMTLLEIYIHMFLEELSLIIKQGLKASYMQTEENTNAFKGKLLVNHHIKHNIVHKERFFLQYDIFSQNIPENRIIKSTLRYLKDKTDNFTLVRRINEYLVSFEDINYSYNYEEDFSRCKNNRLMSNYSKIINWCKIFLKGESFTSNRGKEQVFSLLYPMEKVFESFIGYNISKSEHFNDYEVLLQHSKHYLIESHKKFKLKPDIVLKSKVEAIILDTKWKILNDDERSNYGISQGDLYQMYAYCRKYHSKKIILIYPDNGEENRIMTFKFDEYREVHIVKIDFNNIEESLFKIKNLLL